MQNFKLTGQGRESREEAAQTSTQKKSMPQYYEEYVYGDTIIADIDEDERTVKGQDGSSLHG